MIGTWWQENAEAAETRDNYANASPMETGSWPHSFGSFAFFLQHKLNIRTHWRIIFA